MPMILAVHDETTAGERRRADPLQFDTETITVREIIRQRVRQEIERFNRANSEAQRPSWQEVIEPEPAEQILNGSRADRFVLDWEKQYEKALAGFRGNGLLILINDKQLTDLDEVIHLTPQTEITFLKLVPLIGG